MSTNQVGMTGMFAGARRVRHDPSFVPTGGCASIPALPNTHCQDWKMGSSSGVFRHYGSSVLLPNVGNTSGGRDLVMILGGGTGPDPTYVVQSTSRIMDAGNPSWPSAWGAPENMNFPRMLLNAVLLPDGSVLALGGTDQNYFQVIGQQMVPTPVVDTEIYTKAAGWKTDSPQSSPRMYHSTAVLLPSGFVVSAGGDLRTWDWEVYAPPYFTAGQAIPAFGGNWPGSGVVHLGWSTDWTIQFAPLPVGVTVARVVLMRPCSVTHHSDFDQRYVELQTVPVSVDATDSITVRTPSAPNFAVGAPVQRGLVEAPPGHYMMFLVTSQGTPSQAKWVTL